MNYNQLIKNWHSQAADEDFFSKFIFEYLAFIAFLKKKEFTHATSDRMAVQYLKRDEQYKNEYLREIQRNIELQGSWEAIRIELSRAPLGNASGNEEVQDIVWWNCSQIHLDDQTEEDRNKIKGVIYDWNDWENMVEFWCSIRNNLFHATKNPRDARDQLLVEYGYKTLRPLVEVLLNTKSHIS